MLSAEDKVHLLRSIRKTGFFWSCSLEQIKQIISAFIKMEFREGQQIIKQDEERDAFFIIDNGKISVWTEEQNEKKKIATLEQGDYFAEKTLIAGKPHNTTIITEGYCRVFVLYSREFKKLLMENPILKNHFFETDFQRSEEHGSSEINKNNFAPCII